MKVGCLQFKPEFGKPGENVSRIKQILSVKDFDLIVMPELANSGYLFTSRDELASLSEEIPNGDFCRALLDIADKKNCFIVSGVCERSEGEFYNSAILVEPGGKVYTYRKLQLFRDEKVWFQPGDGKIEVFEVSKPGLEKVNIGLMVCFDWVFPEVARTIALKGAQIICHPSNLVMPYCQTAMFARAVENRVFTLTANRTGAESRGGRELVFTGQSVIIDPEGNYLYRGSSDKEECAVVEIDPSEALNKFINPQNNLFDDRRDEFYFS